MEGNNLFPAVRAHLPGAAEQQELKHHTADACPPDLAVGRGKVNHKEQVVQQYLSLGRFAWGEQQRTGLAGYSNPLTKQGPPLGMRRDGTDLCHPGGISSHREQAALFS